MMSVGPALAQGLPGAGARTPRASRTRWRTRCWSRPTTTWRRSRASIATHADELAAVIIEPFQRLIPPQPGFLQGLREITAAARHPAGLRRGRHRLPPRLRRRPGVLRRRARTSPASARSSAAASRSPRSCASAELMRPFDPGQRRQGRVHLAVRHAQRQPHRGRRGPGHPGRAAQARRLRAPARHRPPPDGRPRRAARRSRASRPRSWASRWSSTSSSPASPSPTTGRSEGRRRPGSHLHHRADQARRGEEHPEDVHVARPHRRRRGQDPPGLRRRPQGAPEEEDATLTG